MKTIGIMQPYFFPYIGYFQLIQAVDVYVNLDHVSFMKSSYMTRNTLKNNIDINVPVSGGSQNKLCTEVLVLKDKKWLDKFPRKLDQLYFKEKNYKTILHQILIPWMELFYNQEQTSISELNFQSMLYINNYLDIETKMISSSKYLTEQKREKGLQDIVKHFEGTHYVNAIGGQKLYTKEDFASQGIDLKFIKNKSELPTTSILDLLIRYDKEIIKQELNNYELI